ncbi:tyrosine-type recombinase/integrase [Arcobacter sp. KX21116]|uniref:tyrosine-type recombinase/integrase n=1 Tax=Arcobacter iocasae TaxID=2906515 RepID=UPI0035D50317
MNKYIGIEIVNKDCKGMFLECDAELDKITSIQEANKLIGKKFKIQLRTRVEGKRGKKIFTFESKKITFLKAIEYVSSKRVEVRETLKTKGTLREKRVENVSINLEEGETFLDKVETFLETKTISARPSTIQNYLTALNLHSKPLHNKSIENIAIHDVQKIINSLLSSRAPATVILYVRTLRAFLSKYKASIISEWEELSLPYVDNKVDYTLTLADTKKIIYAMKNYSGTDVEGEVFYQFEEIKNIFTFLLTGRRINEVLQLKYSDINFEDNTFKVPASTAKGKKELVFNLDKYLLEAIKSQARLNNIDLSKTLTDKKLFKYTKETPRVHFQNLLKAMGLPKLRLHDIRHMLATTLVQNKVPIADISVLLGHSSIAITEARYANKSKDQASRALSSFNDIIG